LAFDLVGSAWKRRKKPTPAAGSAADKIQVRRVELPAGEHELNLIPWAAAIRPSASAVRRITIADGRSTYLLATSPARSSWDRC